MQVTPHRVVSLVPSMTETVCMLGAADRLVGVTRYCVEPAAELGDAARIGGTKNPDLEAIAALGPELVIANSEENRPEHIAWLRERFPVLEQCPRSVPEAGRAVLELAERLDLVEAAEPLLVEIEGELARAEVERSRRPPLRAFYPIWPKPWMSINRDTYIHDVLDRAGAVNVCADRPERYPELAAGELAELAPEIVLLPSEPWEFDEAWRRELAAAGTFGPASLVCVDGRDFCWHGGRSGAALGRAVDLLQRYRAG